VCKLNFILILTFFFFYFAHLNTDHLVDEVSISLSTQILCHFNSSSRPIARFLVAAFPIRRNHSQFSNKRA